MSFGGGRIVATNDGAGSEVHYSLTDHLGSTRVVVKVTDTGRQDLDRRDYYPFGKEWGQTDADLRQPVHFFGQGVATSRYIIGALCRFRRSVLRFRRRAFLATGSVVGEVLSHQVI